MSYGPTWPEQRAVALLRDLNRCLICGHLATDVHHRRIIGMGGRAKDPDRHAAAKLMSLCRLHHDQVHMQRELGDTLGYFMKPGEDPEAKPVWSPADSSWFELSDRGTRMQYPNWRPPEVQIL
jgi:Putative HNHc nuclease